MYGSTRSVCSSLSSPHVVGVLLQDFPSPSAARLVLCIFQSFGGGDGVCFGFYFAPSICILVTLFTIDMANVLEWSEFEFSTEIFWKNFPFLLRLYHLSSPSFHASLCNHAISGWPQDVCMRNPGSGPDRGGTLQVQGFLHLGLSPFFGRLPFPQEALWFIGYHYNCALATLAMSSESSGSMAGIEFPTLAQS